MAQMKKPRFIHKNGKTILPYPIYPNEVKDDSISFKRFKDRDIEHPELDEETKKKHAQFAFNLIAKNLNV